MEDCVHRTPHQHVLTNMFLSLSPLESLFLSPVSSPWYMWRSTFLDLGVFADISKVRSNWIRGGPWPNTLYKKRREEKRHRDTETQSGAGHGAIEAGIEWSTNKPRNSKDCQEPSGAEGDMEGFFPQAFRESVALPTTWFRTLAFNTVKQYVSVFLSHLVCGILLQQPEETNTLSINYLLVKSANICYSCLPLGILSNTPSNDLYNLAWFVYIIKNSIQEYV